MIVSIHQPEHFPYLGYFQKMADADAFVLLDNVNYRKNYFQNRNRFMNKNGVEELFTIPVPKDSVKMNIKDVVVSDTNWRDKVLKQILYNFGVDLSYIYESSKLIDINTASIVYCMHRLGILTSLVRASDLNVTGSKSELLANICREMGATKYISGPSGKDYLEMDYFEGIEVEFFNPKVPDIYTTLSHI